MDKLTVFADHFYDSRELWLAIDTLVQGFFKAF